MMAIEFTTEITGDTIEIPEAHRGQINGTVRVIVLPSESSEQPDMIANLLAHPLQIADFSPLTRDETNERG
jgi:hypothetical protein